MSNAIATKPAVDAKIRSWDQQGETAEEYRSFLIYLSQGMARTVPKAATLYYKEISADENAPTFTSVAYAWEAMSKKHNWLQRAGMYDVFQIRRAINQTSGLFVKALRKTSIAVLKALTKQAEKMEPQNFQDILKALHAIQAILPQESLDRVYNAAAGTSWSDEPVKYPARLPGRKV